MVTSIPTGNTGVDLGFFQIFAHRTWWVSYVKHIHVWGP